MFVANKSNGERLSLLEINKRETLIQIRKNESFTCPGCHKPVRLRLGNKKIPHFAHLNTSQCESFSEHESQYHLKGKMQLFEWLISQSLSVELEPYLSSIHQRPDLLLQYKGQKYAIEFQCSSISHQAFIKRTTSYYSHGFIPIWILGSSNLTRKSSIITHMSAFQWLFTQNSSDLNRPPILLYYSPVDMQLIKLHQLYPFSPTDLISNYTIFQLKSITFSQLFSIKQSDQTELIEEWQLKKQRWRNISSRYLVKSARKFANELYIQHIFPSCLPSEVGIPLKSLYWIETSAMIWQMYILLDSILPLQNGDIVTFQAVYQKFQKRKWKGLIKIRSLPLIKHGHYSFAVMEYLNVLETLGILKRIKGSTFKKMKDIEELSNIEEAQKLDNAILNQLFRR